MAIPLFDSLFKLLATLINSVWGRKERRIKAAATFREAFLRELHGLYPLPSDWPPGTGIEPRLKHFSCATERCFDLPPIHSQE